MDHLKLILTTIRSLIDAGFSMCYWDNDDERRANVSGQFMEGRFLALPMKPSGKSYIHYDVSLAVNPNDSYKDWKAMSKANLVLDL